VVAMAFWHSGNALVLINEVNLCGDG